jgi:hypothetical protein
MNESDKEAPYCFNAGDMKKEAHQESECSDAKGGALERLD